tara:strand:+ start:694 stop:885 length:192 start_codon:yes stop_codon:yes gene_type:complete
MSLDEVTRLLDLEKKILQDREDNIEEAMWLIKRLENEDYSSYDEKEDLEKDLKVILEELKIEY